MSDKIDVRAFIGECVAAQGRSMTSALVLAIEEAYSRLIERIYELEKRVAELERERVHEKLGIRGDF